MTADTVLLTLEGHFSIFCLFLISPPHEGHLVSDQGETQFREELHRKAEEMKRRSFEEESRRIAREADERARENTKNRLAEDSQAYSKKLREAQEERQRQETALKTQEEAILGRIRKEASKKIEARKRQEQERLRKEQEEKRQAEEAERLRREEELRIAAEKDRARREEERAKILEAEKKRADEERHRKEDEIRRKTEERQRKEEEARAQGREREERIKSLIARAEVFFGDGDFEHASVEVAKALVNDPANARALELERQIKEAQGEKTGGEKGADKPKKELRPLHVAGAPITPRKKAYASAMMIVAVIAILVVSILVILELRKTGPVTTVAIAVFPLTSPSDVLEDKILGSSLGEVTAAGLRNYKSFVVMDFASAYPLAQKAQEPDQAAFHLGYRYALQGTLFRTATGFAINVKLIDSVRNPVWSQHFETPAESLAVVGEQIPIQLAAALGSEPAERPAGFTPYRGRTSTEAYTLYMRGLEILHRPTPEGTRNALELFREAIGQDDQFAEALAAAGSALAMRVERDWDRSDSAFSQAKDFATRAISVDPTSGEGYRVLGTILSEHNENGAAIAAIDTALRYSPKSGTILLSRAKVLLKVGKYKDALAVLGKAYSIDPCDPDLLQTYAVAHQLAGRIRDGGTYSVSAAQWVDDLNTYLIGPFADAVVLDPDLSLTQSERVAAACQARLQNDPGDYATMYRLARLLQVTGKPLDASALLSKAETVLRAVVQKDPKDVRALMYLALTLTRQGKFPEATELASKAEKTGKDIPEVKYRIAQMYSLQMYSLKEKKVDEKAKENALQALHDAASQSYRFDEIASADFYNLYELPEFRTAIEQAM
jgi:TolB-like protein/Tfp pilus assembly protein PilF